jgi:hypothetical protein
MAQENSSSPGGTGDGAGGLGSSGDGALEVEEESELLFLLEPELSAYSAGAGSRGASWRVAVACARSDLRRSAAVILKSAFHWCVVLAYHGILVAPLRLVPRTFLMSSTSASSIFASSTKRRFFLA